MTVEDRVIESMEFNGDMRKSSIDKMDPRYIAACIRQLPTLADPKEVEIIKVMEKEALSTPLGRDIIDKEKLAIKANLKDILAHLGDSSYTHAQGRQTVAEVAGIINATIVSGQERLQELDKGKPVLFSANHLGVYKLAGLTPEDLSEIGFKSEHDIPDIYYSPIPFYAPFYPAAKQLNDDIYMAALEEPGLLGELSRATGYVDVPPSADMLPGFDGTGPGRVEMLTESTGEFFEERPSSAVLVFPEGGTTGKRNGGNPYKLEKFHSGLFVIASNLEVPVVLLAHHFDPNKGFEVAVAEVIRLSKNSTSEEIQKAAAHAQEVTQAELNSLRSK